MDDECGGLRSAVEAYGQCPNLDPDDRTWAHAVIESTDQSIEAGSKANPDAEWQRAIAVACHKAAVSMRHATERCLAGRRPRVD
jgi:hypothetical protein